MSIQRVLRDEQLASQNGKLLTEQLLHVSIGDTVWWTCISNTLTHLHVINH